MARLVAELQLAGTPTPDSPGDELPYPGGPAGAVDLYLKKDIFLPGLPESATRLIIAGLKS